MSRSVEPHADPAALSSPILAPSQTRLQTSLVAAVLLLALAVSAMGAAVWWVRSPATPVPVPVPAAYLPHTQPAPVATPVPPAPAILTLRTDPPGSEVWEGETMLGTTPLELPLGSGSTSRTLELRAEGYATHTIVQPPSTASVQHNVALQRERNRVRPLPPDLELREQR